ncbi:MAG: hypothetical protein OXN89_10085 [Bryobacterales bacterium]|nr:hypothetical protein [Bryobacterales bacterium]
MPREMGSREAFVIDARPLHRPPHDATHAAAGQSTVRGTYAQEHDRPRSARPGFEDIGPDGVADLLRQRQGRAPARLAADPDRGLFPVDVPKLQVGAIAGAQRETCQQQQDGPVLQPFSHGGCVTKPEPETVELVR